MNAESLFHFFPRKYLSVDNTLGILKSIFDNGLFLTKEIIPVHWRDYYGLNRSRRLKIEQYRFCLTAITNKEELLNHSEVFGHVGLEFDTGVITKLGGFPVFYVPSPGLDSEDIEEYKGISLLYRIAEIQELLEFVHSNKLLRSPDIDIENMLGAIKTLSNICYPTNRQPGPAGEKKNCYNQREWRIIYGLTPESVLVEKVQENFSIRSFHALPIHTLIKKIVLCGSPGLDGNAISTLWEEVNTLVANYGLRIPVAILHRQPDESQE